MNKERIRAYKEYFRYIMEHKKNVFKVCWSKKMYIHAFTHDLSKFRPREFFPYAEWFYGKHGVNANQSDLNKNLHLNTMHLKCKIEFDMAWERHYNKNKHHWNYWDGRYMPIKYVKQMVCDWTAMSMKFGDTPQEFYMNNYDKIVLHRRSRLELEMILGLHSNTRCIDSIWKEKCKRRRITMREDLIRLGYIKNKIRN